MLVNMIQCRTELSCSRGKTLGDTYQWGHEVTAWLFQRRTSSIIFAPYLTFDIVNDLNIDFTEPKQIAKKIKGVGDTISKTIYDNWLYRSAIDLIVKNSTYKAILIEQFDPFVWIGLPIHTYRYNSLRGLEHSWKIAHMYRNGRWLARLIYNYVTHLQNIIYIYKIL